tara:strand:+ start:1597 stop:2199 length:603 start_codon:yes stop_codon:yes gene_type:complete
MKKKIKKERGNLFVRNYKKCWRFLQESSDYHIISLGVFCSFIIIGFAFPIFFQEKIFEFMRELLLQVQGLSVSEMISFIFFNNLGASFFAVVLGVVLGVFPIGAAIVNGYLLGFVSRFAVNESGSILILWRLLPHGIFEIPAIILSIGFGLKLGVELWKKDPWNVLKRNIVEAMRFFVFVIVPLLIIAAIVEGFLIFWSG